MFTWWEKYKNILYLNKNPRFRTGPKNLGMQQISTPKQTYTCRMVPVI